MRTLRVRVWRGGPQGGSFQSYEVPRQESQSVLDVVTYIQRVLDPSLAYRFACRVGMCGSCAMTVNGVARWTCRTHVDKVAKGDALEIAPLANLPVIRDLVAESYPAMSEDQIVATTNCVNVRFAGTGLDVDVVPVLYEGEPDDVGCLVSKDDGTKLRTSVRQHLDFIRGRKKAHPKDLAQLIRFTKWWARQQKKRDGEFKCKSFMLELLWVHLTDGGTDLSDYAVALEQCPGWPARRRG